MSHTYEVEIKSLLGSKEKAADLKQKLQKVDPALVHRGSHSQLNHYFNMPDDLSKLENAIVPHVSQEKQENLRRILEEGEDFSIRSRKADSEVLFVVKASVDAGSSANAVSRIEFESPVDMSLNKLDRLLLNAGLTYQAKWSREREEYASGDMTITIDKNAGYGYLAEFERVIDRKDLVDKVRQELVSFMQALGVEELPQDRLERMFTHYNKNWEDYYGTDKTFTIE